MAAHQLGRIRGAPGRLPPIMFIASMVAAAALSGCVQPASPFASETGSESTRPSTTSATRTSSGSPSEYGATSLWLIQDAICLDLPWEQTAKPIYPLPARGGNGTAPEMDAYYSARNVSLTQSGSYFHSDGGSDGQCGRPNGVVYWAVAAQNPDPGLGWKDWSGERWWFKVQVTCRMEPWQANGPISDPGVLRGTHENETKRMIAFVQSSHTIGAAAAYDTDPQFTPGACGTRGSWRYWVLTEGTWPLADGWLPVAARTPPWPPIAA